MAEYITKERAKDLIVAASSVKSAKLARMLSKLEDEHPADVVEVVRCKDCKHLIVDERLLILSSNPETATFCMLGIGGASSDFYCAYGARMEGEENA